MVTKGPNFSLLECGEKTTVFFRCQFLDEHTKPFSSVTTIHATVHADDDAKTETKPRADVNGANDGTFTASVAVSSITTQAPTDVKITTSAAHKLRTGDTVYLSGITGTDAAELNSKTFEVEVIDETSFYLADIASLSLSTLSGGTVAVGVFELLLASTDSRIVGTVAERFTEKHTLTLEVVSGSLVVNDDFPYDVRQLQVIT